MRYYLCIDLKSFYASVECVERGLDPLTTKLVVADPERTDKTICLAVSPALKAMGVHNRCRVFEIPKSFDYIMAVPRMQLYIDYAARIYGIYLDHFSKDDIYVYSIDEAFMDVTDYLALYHTSPRELGIHLLNTIYETLGVRATCGIGTNLYLAKIALDLTAKHSPDFIGELTPESFRERLGTHMPLTDFWRIGPGIATRLAKYGILCQQDIADAPEDLLYQLFGIDAELLIDHAHGIEPVTMADIKAYHSCSNSLSSGQVLPRDYAYEEGKLIVKEMTDLLCLDLVAKKLFTKSLTLHVSYSDQYPIPSSHGTVSFEQSTSADYIIVPAIAALYDSIVLPIPIRRVSVVCNNVKPEEYYQYSLFQDREKLERNRRVSETIYEVKERFGSNAVLKGMNLLEGGRTIERNTQIGGHRSGEKAKK